MQWTDMQRASERRAYPNDGSGSRADGWHPHPDRPHLGVKRTKTKIADFGLSGVRYQGYSGYNWVVYVTSACSHFRTYGSVVIARGFAGRPPLNSLP